MYIYTPPSLFQFANFNVVKGYVFPVWLAIIPLVFFVLEVRKQLNRVSECVLEPCSMSMGHMPKGI